MHGEPDLPDPGMDAAEAALMARRRDLTTVFGIRVRLAHDARGVDAALVGGDSLDGQALRARPAIR